MSCSRSLSGARQKGSPSTSRKSSRARPTLTRSAASGTLTRTTSESTTTTATTTDDDDLPLQGAAAPKGTSGEPSTPSSSNSQTDYFQQTVFSEAFDPELVIRFHQEMPLRTFGSLDEALWGQGIADYTFAPDGLLGRGKFSAVYLAHKGRQSFALKHTPLHPHHPLIASRLLREPTILAQLPCHPNLVRVYETIRTPGHLYLVEEYLEGYVTLDSFVKSFPQGKLTVEQATIVLDQLVDVVRDALHRPIFIAHRDIKAENVLIHPQTMHIVLIDFGLSTHFSEREARLSTTCGSPAYHSPELWLSTQKPAGAVRYYGPEIDVWCCGLTVLRCLTGRRCPIGLSHASLGDMGEKVADALLSIADLPMRTTLAGFLQLNGLYRWAAFRDYRISASAANWRPACPERPFKGTTFIPTVPRYSLNLEFKGADNNADLLAPPRRGQRSITSTYPHTLRFENPQQHPNQAIVSYFKYCLRCAGIVYHQWPAADDFGPSSTFTTPAVDVGSFDEFPFTLQEPSLHAFKVTVYFHCALTTDALPAAGPSILKRLKAHCSRSSSTPPNQPKKPRTAHDDDDKRSADTVTTLDFWLCIESGGQTNTRTAPSYQLRVSDKRVLGCLKRAVSMPDNDQAVCFDSPLCSASADEEEGEEHGEQEIRGRRRTKAGSSGQDSLGRPQVSKKSSSQSTLHSARSRRSVSASVLSKS